MRQSVVEKDEGEHAVGDWGLESGFCCEDGVAVDWIIVAYCFCEFADLCHGDFPRNAFWKSYPFSRYERYIKSASQ